VQVWDQSNEPSGWFQGPNFKTPKHRCPEITDITWLPTKPGAGEETEFTITAACYDADNKCNSYTWDFGDGTPPVTTTAPTTTHIFPAKKSYTITVNATDADGYTCSASKPIDITWKLPTWTEILPF